MPNEVTQVSYTSASRRVTKEVSTFGKRNRWAQIFSKDICANSTRIDLPKPYQGKV